MPSIDEVGILIRLQNLADSARETAKRPEDEVSSVSLSRFGGGQADETASDAGAQHGEDGFEWRQSPNQIWSSSPVSFPRLSLNILSFPCFPSSLSVLRDTQSRGSPVITFLHQTRVALEACAGGSRRHGAPVRWRAFFS